jgi:high affinity Mn2+ porin
MRAIVPASVTFVALTAAQSVMLAASEPAPGLPGLRSYNWTGVYVGGNVSYTQGHAHNTLLDPGAETASNVFGSYYGGLQVGYNYLLRSGVLLGVEADISFPNFLEGDDVVSTRSTVAGTVVEKLDFVSTVRGRLGYAFDRWLIYGTGGVAWSQARLIEDPGPTGAPDLQKHLRTGWALGAGAEVAVAPEWTARSGGCGPPS